MGYIKEEDNEGSKESNEDTEFEEEVSPDVENVEPVEVRKTKLTNVRLLITRIQCLRRPYVVYCGSEGCFTNI